MSEDLNSMFSRSREICPNLPDGVHKIAMHIVKRMGRWRNLSPQELALFFTATLDEENIKDFELFPQLIDELVDNTYATKFRKICQDVIGINPPIIITPVEYPENITAAVEWWTKAVLFRDASNMSTAFQKYFQRKYTSEEITIFKSTLAEEIEKELCSMGEVWLSSEWSAKGILKIAGDRIGVNPLFGYPKASMMVYPNEVKVCNGAYCETIFCNY